MDIFTNNAPPQSPHTDEELDYLDTLERAWKESVPIYTLQSALLEFPLGKNAALRKLKHDINALHEDIDSLHEYRTTLYDGFVNTADFKSQPHLIQWLDSHINQLRANYERDIKRKTFEILRIEGKTQATEAKRSGVTDLQIQQARETPLPTLLNVNRTKKAVCLWHDDRVASMHVYNDHVYCYSCHKSGDAIAVYMQLHKCDFISAVKALAI